MLLNNYGASGVDVKRDLAVGVATTERLGYSLSQKVKLRSIATYPVQLRTCSTFLRASSSVG
jgi:hypothetical protein